MNIIKLLNKICAVNLSEPCRDDLKRLSDENKRLVDILLQIDAVLNHSPFNRDDKLCEIKLLIDEVKK